MQGIRVIEKFAKDHAKAVRERERLSIMLCSGLLAARQRHARSRGRLGGSCNDHSARAAVQRLHPRGSVGEPVPKKIGLF